MKKLNASSDSTVIWEYQEVNDRMHEYMAD